MKEGLLKPGFTVGNQWHGETAKSEAEMRANVTRFCVMAPENTEYSTTTVST